MKPGDLDLTMHVDPKGGKVSVEAEIEKEIGGGVQLDVDAQVDESGKPTVTIGIKIPIP
jgi:hypothetical protein